MRAEHKNEAAHGGEPGAAGRDAPDGAHIQPHFTPTSTLRQDFLEEAGLLEVARLRAAAETACAQGDRTAYWRYCRAMLLRQAELYPLIRGQEMRQ